ncbi:MAG: T9SS type A sorting domain-containing protein [Saprospiraceae bacterium]
MGNKKAIDSRGLFIRKNNRIFSNTAYTDDGGTTWEPLALPNDDYFSYFNLGHDGKLYYVNNKSVYISDDDGKSFTRKDFNSDYISYISSTKGDKFVIGGAFNEVCNPEIFMYTIQDSTLQKLNNEIGTYHAINVFAGIDEYIFVNVCDLRYITKNPIQDWEKVNFEADMYELISRFLYLSNREIIALSEFNIYKSKDNGKNWNKPNQKVNFYSNSNIIEKNGKLFLIGSDSIYFSNDFGDTWDSKFTGLGLFGYEAYSTQYSDKMDIYYYDSFKNVSKYNVVTLESKPVNLDNPYIDEFITSFDGKILYVVRVEGWPFKYTLETSYDYGTTFVSKQLDGFDNSEHIFIKADHLGNIYLYTKNVVQMSSDDGQNWVNITPDFPELVSINDLNVSYDNYIYLATTGMGILKYKPQLATPNGLKVIVYDDLNKNCQKDNIEPSVPLGKVVVNDLYVRELDDNGEASFRLHTTQNKVSLVINESLYEICQEIYDITLDDDYTELSIPLKAKKYCADVQASISAPFLRRCFDNTYYGQVCNNGNIEAEDIVAKVKLDPYFDLKETSVPIVSHIGDELVLDIKNLKAGECISFHLKINLSCDATLGQEHCMEIGAISNTKDCDDITSKVTYLDCEENVGSYDPNDKSIFVNGVKNKEYIEQGDKVKYLIRFQNTGTDTAFTVKIQDPISSKFDVTSIVPVAASHEYTWCVENGVLNVTFDHIMLVDSFRNEPLSHGFIKFEIALNRSTERNQDVSNLAGIFFDFNEPVITNEVTTPVGKPVSTYDPDENSISLYPNPTNDIIHITSSNTSFKDAQIIIYNESGNIAMTTGLQAESNRQIDVSSLPSGFYIIHIIGDKTAYKAKFVKM